MKAQFPTLFERANVGPRVHRIFSAAGLASASLLMLALIVVGEGEMGARFG